VYYRASARQQALQDGIVGYARNLADGTVEILACGEERAVLKFIDWLWIGPSGAKVLAVSVESIELQPDAWPGAFRTS
jgi:acylphosphatase